MQDKILDWAKELQSISQAGLFYGKDDFDKERYARIREIAAQMFASCTDIPLETVKKVFCSDSGYQTPKIDTRAAIFKDEKILLVYEKDGRWSLPGGWCEYNLSPAQNTVKEAKEEAGLDVTVKKLIAVQDRKLHNEPPYPYDVVKIFFLCESNGGHFEKNIETSACGYFSADELPELAEEKCTKNQIGLCFEAAHSESWIVRFD